MMGCLTLEILDNEENYYESPIQENAFSLLMILIAVIMLILEILRAIVSFVSGIWHKKPPLARHSTHPNRINIIGDSPLCTSIKYILTSESKKSKLSEMIKNKFQSNSKKATKYNI